MGLYSVYTENSWFEWHADKAERNRGKHGIGFDEAATAFHDPAALIADDGAHSTRERRQRLIGEAASGRILVVSFTLRGERIRLISARPANRRERGLYGQIRRIPF